MKASNRQAGISFCKGHIQLAEIDHDKRVELITLGERETSMDFGKSSANLNADHPQLVTFVYELEELMKRHKVNTKGISFAIPTEPLFINILPTDAALQKAELAEYLRWELSQYVTDSPVKDFIIDSHALPSEDAAVRQLFMVGVRRGIVSFFQKVASELRLKLNVLDVDHFSTEKTLRYNYPELDEKVVALCGVQYGHLDGSLLVNGQMVDYRSIRIDRQDEVHTAVRAYAKHLREKDGIPQPFALLLHGINLPAENLKQLQEELKMQVVHLNALRKLSASKKLYAPFVKENSRFAAAIGVALRTS